MDKAPCLSNFLCQVVGVVSQNEVANACSTEAMDLVQVGSMFGQIGPTSQNVRGHFRQKCPKFENFVQTQMGVSGNFEFKHLGSCVFAMSCASDVA